MSDSIFYEQAEKKLAIKLCRPNADILCGCPPTFDLLAYS